MISIVSISSCGRDVLEDEEVPDDAPNIPGATIHEGLQAVGTGRQLNWKEAPGLVSVSLEETQVAAVAAVLE